MNGENNGVVVLAAIGFLLYLYFFVVKNGITLTTDISQLSDNARYAITSIFVIVGLLAWFKYK